MFHVVLLGSCMLLIMCWSPKDKVCNIADFGLSQETNTDNAYDVKTVRTVHYLLDQHHVIFVGRENPYQMDVA